MNPASSGNGQSTDISRSTSRIIANAEQGRLVLLSVPEPSLIPAAKHLTMGLTPCRSHPHDRNLDGWSMFHFPLHR